MNGKKESFFWTSYSDLMTSLFFIMLVLFVLVIVLLHNKMETTEQQLREIKEVVNSTKDLKGKYFAYRSDYKKYILNIKCSFPEDKYEIAELDQTTLNKLESAGEEIASFLGKHKNNQYIVIIEGQASRNSEKQMLRNYNLSFQRAISLRIFWKDSNINFGDNCELQIASSGDGRLNVNTMRETERDDYHPNPDNQRFLIYIIPKNIIHE